MDDLAHQLEHNRTPQLASLRRKRWWTYALHIGLTAIVVGGVIKAGEKAIHEFQSLDDRGVSLVIHWEWCLVAAGCYAVSLLPAAWFWGRILRSLGQQVTATQVLRAYLVGQVGKYIPGKAWVVIIRAALIVGTGVQTAMAAASVFIETLTMMSVGAAMATLYVVVKARSDPQLLWTAVALAAIVTVPTLPPLFRPILGWIAVKGKRQEVILAVREIGFVQLWEGWLAMCLLWLGFGLSLGFVLQSLSIPGYSFELAKSGFWAMPPLVASVALATVGGFVMFFLPAGLGAREFILAAVLAPHLVSTCLHGNTISATLVAGIAAVMLRMVWLGTEVVLAVVFWLLPHFMAIGRYFKARAKQVAHG